MNQDVVAADAPASRSGFRITGYIPLAVFFVMAVFLGIGLTMNPRNIPSPLIGKPVPEFTLPPVKGRTLGLATADLRGEVTMVNVFASWCLACREEHPILMEIGEKGIVPLHGLNYKDKPDDAQAWLDDMGDPYKRTGADINGRVAIDWGVYGVPETFIVDREGKIAFKHIGAITPEIFREKMMPVITSLRQQQSNPHE